MPIDNACSTGRRGGVATVHDSSMFIISVSNVCHDAFIMIMRIPHLCHEWSWIINESYMLIMRVPQVGGCCHCSWLIHIHDNDCSICVPWLIYIDNARSSGRGGVATSDSSIFMIMIVPYVCHDSFILIMRVPQVGGVLPPCALYAETGGMQGKMPAKGACVLQAVAAWCTLLRSVAVCCSLLQSVADTKQWLVCMW